MGNSTSLGEFKEASELYFYRQYFLSVFPNIPSISLRFMEIMTTHFLFGSRYSKQLSHNFRMILRDIGSVVAGDEKLLRFTGMCAIAMTSIM